MKITYRTVIRTLVRGIILLLAAIGVVSLVAFADRVGAYRESKRVISPKGDLDLVVLEGTGWTLGAIRDFGYEVYVVDHSSKISRLPPRGLIMKTAEGTEVSDVKWDAEQNVDLTISVGLVERLERHYDVPVSAYNHKVGKIRVHQLLQ